MRPSSRLSLSLAIAACLAGEVVTAQQPAGSPADALQVKSIDRFHIDRTIRSCALSPDGKQVLLGFDKFGWSLLDISRALKAGGDYDERWGHSTWRGESPSDLFVDVSPDGRTVAAGSASARTYRETAYPGLVEISHAATGQVQADLNAHQAGVRAVKFNPSGDTLATADADGVILLWDWRRGAVRLKLAGHTAGVTALAWSSDGRALASTGRDRTIRIWNAATGAQTSLIAGLHSTPTTLAWSPDAGTIATASTERDIWLWDTTTREERYFALPFGSVSAMAWSPDGRLLVTAGGPPESAKDGRADFMVFWDARQRRTAAMITADGKTSNGVMSTGGTLVDVCLSRDGKTVAFVGQGDEGKGDITVWALGDWKQSDQAATTAAANSELELELKAMQESFLDGVKAERHIAAGEYFESQKDWATAEREYRRAFALDAAVASGHRHLGRALEGLHQSAEAEAELRQAVKDDPADAKAHGFLAQTLVALHKDAEAEAEFRRAQALDAKNPAWHLELGRLFDSRQRYAEAAAAYRESLRLDAFFQPATVHAALGRVLAILHRPTESETELRDALRFASNNAWIHGVLAETLVDLHKDAEAEAELRRARQLDPKEAEWALELGGLLESQRRYAEAEEHYRDALRLDAAFAGSQGHRGLGHVLLERQALQEAETELTAALTANPKDRDALWYRAWSRLSLDKGELALADARTYLDPAGWRAPDAPYAVFIGVLGARQAGQTAAATSLLDECATRCDTSQWPYAIVRYLRRELTESELLAMADSVDKSTEVRTYVGMDLLLAGKRSEAIDHLQWVRDHGNARFIESLLARAQLARLGRDPAR